MLLGGDDSKMSGWVMCLKRSQYRLQQRRKRAHIIISHVSRHWKASALGGISHEPSKRNANNQASMKRHDFVMGDLKRPARAYGEYFSCTELHSNQTRSLSKPRKSATGMAEIHLDFFSGSGGINVKRMGMAGRKRIGWLAFGLTAEFNWP
jgi:hypothetical protein